MPTYLVTGASSGIGLGLCKSLVEKGSKVFATCRKRASSGSGVDALSELEAKYKDLLIVIEGVDLTDDAVGDVLLKGVGDEMLDVLIHNAGTVNGKRDTKDTGGIFGEQFLENITMDLMRAAFEVNTLGVLRVQQALDAKIKPDGGKVAVISTGMGSIGDNSSGGTYAYRASKTAVNMITKGFSCDLKKRGIPVAAINPGLVITDFGPGPEQMAKMGGKTVEKAVDGIFMILDGLTLENTGCFMTVPSGDETAPKLMPW